jgi:hypothetical protein
MMGSKLLLRGWASDLAQVWNINNIAETPRGVKHYFLCQEMVMMPPSFTTIAASHHNPLTFFLTAHTRLPMNTLIVVVGSRNAGQG